MSLSDHYETANDSLVKRLCKTCEWYRGLSPRDQEFFDEKAVEALSVRGNMQRLRRAVISAGHVVARSTFHGHMHEHHAGLADECRKKNP